MAKLRKKIKEKIPILIASAGSGLVASLLEKAGANIPRPPGPLKHGTTHIAFVEDPDGYKIELVDLDTRG